MDVAFPNATAEELKNMPDDEACAICLKTMASAKRSAFVCVCLSALFVFILFFVVAL